MSGNEPGLIISSFLIQVFYRQQGHVPIVERIQYTGQRSLIGQVTDQGRQLLFLHLVGGYDMHASSQQLKSVVLP